MFISVSRSSQCHPKKEIDKWSNKDHLIYFSNQYEHLTTHPFYIPKEAWVGMMSRMKGFRTKLNLDNEKYKEYVDNVFNVFFTQDNYIPTFGAIVSEKVFYVTNKLLKNRNCSNSEFEQLRNQLYSSDLFRRLK